MPPSMALQYPGQFSYYATLRQQELLHTSQLIAEDVVDVPDGESSYEYR